MKNAKKTPSINKKIVPVINMFKMLPQAKYKIVTENNPPPPFNSFKRAKCYPNQKIHYQKKKKQEPKKFKVKTCHQAQKDNPILNLFSKLEMKKGQDPLEDLDLGKKILQARDSNDKIERDKKNTPDRKWDKKK